MPRRLYNVIKKLSPEEVMQIVRDNDGVGSGVDGDTIDGIHGIEFSTIQDLEQILNNSPACSYEFIQQPTLTLNSNTVYGDTYTTNNQFSGPHTHSQWRILDTATNTVVLDTGLDNVNLTSYTPDPMYISSGYQISVRYISNTFSSIWSNWLNI